VGWGVSNRVHRTRTAGGKGLTRLFAARVAMAKVSPAVPGFELLRCVRDLTRLVACQI